jgi:hypothetical protein
VWVKNYTRLLHDPAYLGLTFHQRGVLHGLWMEYATSNRQIPDSTLTISRRLGERVTRATLDSLARAGLLAFSASRPLAPRYHEASPREREREPKGSLSQEDASGRAKDGPPPRPERAQENGLYRRAEMWVEAVGAREVPADAFPRVLREEFPKLTAEQLHALEAKAAESRVEEDIIF